ncbi:GMC oxidoreductase [Streptomyces sp. NPDC101150]|uniref:GMC oxidoreductase n=1 Tax=Streptomyces sp. NPDC101150 TaxID=3366114 RepID=UPI0037FBDA3A
MTRIDKRVREVDLLVVGSGPAGSAFARRVFDHNPSTSILMVDAGPQLTRRAGTNTVNLRGAEYQDALAGARGPDAGILSADDPLAAYVQSGTYLLRPPAAGADLQADMPLAAVSSNVGGMGAHWACSCPSPGGSEVIPSIPRADFDAAFQTATELLSVTTSGFPRTSLQDNVERLLGKVCDGGRPPERQVQPMPLACQPNGAVPTWTGTEQILGEQMLGESSGTSGTEEFRFALRGDTLCRRLLHTNGRVHAAELEHRPTGERYTVRAGAVMVAGDALRTPQLLWESGIRAPALGRYLNDQPMIIATVAVDPALVDSGFLAHTPDSHDARDHLRGVTWVPFDDAQPWHGQVHYFDPRFVQNSSMGPFVVLSWFLPKDLSADNRVTFDDTQRDPYGIAAMTIQHRLSDADRARIADAIGSMEKAAAAIGTFLPGAEPRLFPSGCSLHYQGTVRTGAEDDGTSVCDSSSRVWGMQNLYVGGNGVISTSTACNPTATSVALAVLAADHAAGAQ